MFEKDNNLYGGLDIWGRVLMSDEDGVIRHVNTEDVMSSLFGGWNFASI